MAEQLPVLVIDDRALERDGATKLLETDGRFQVIASAASMHEALSKLNGTPPSLCLINSELVGQDPISIARDARIRWPSVRIVMIVPAAHDPVVTRAFSLGVDGLVTRWDDYSVVLTAIDHVLQGRRYYTAAINARMKARGDGEGAEAAASVTNRPHGLTPREFEVMTHLVAGRTVRETAAQMNLAVNTVDNHKTRLMKKLNVHSNVLLTRYAIREGLAEL